MLIVGGGDLNDLLVLSNSISVETDHFMFVVCSWKLKHLQHVLNVLHKLTKNTIALFL